MALSIHCKRYYSNAGERCIVTQSTAASEKREVLHPHLKIPILELALAPVSFDSSRAY